MNGNVRQAIETIDSFGFSNNYGLVPGGPSQTSYSVNPAIQNRTQGASTFQITISAARTGTGSGNTYDPIYLFGGDAYTNASVGYNAVSPAAKVTSAGTANGKNTIRFRYDAVAGEAANSTLYTVTLSTSGEYPFILSSLSGNNKMTVVGMQMRISDASETEQLTNPMATFFLDEFGKATSNDLTTPQDLYQQQTDGIFLPHTFEISGRRGLITNVQNVDGFSVSYYFWVQK